jgi:diguanylate cyclase (GGDEF)-like protein
MQLSRNFPPATTVPQANQQLQDTALRQRLDEFISEAQRNEQKLRRFERLELQLISLNSIYDLVKTLIYPEQNVFRWDMVSLVLLDPEYELRRMLEDEGACLDQHPSLVFASALSDLGNDYPHSLFPTLAPYSRGKYASLFPQSQSRPRSVALLPLVRYGKLFGSLNIGSFNAERFVKGTRTDFFEHFAAIVAICIENAANVQRLKRQGITDTLTSLNNRRFFEQRLQEEIEVSRRSKMPLSCMMLDVDYFKKVNDSYGHQVGDQVLREVASLIRAQLRGSDVLSRYGGEEFVALLSNTDSETAQDIAERVRSGIEKHIFSLPSDDKFNVTISIGVATYISTNDSTVTSSDGEILVGDADRCLYAAKGAGRNAIVSAGDLTPGEQDHG